MAAEVRDVGQMTGVLKSLQATSADIAPATADAVGFQTAQALGLDRASNLELVQERALPNNVGRTLRFAQTYNGVRIWGQHVTVDMDADNRTVGITGTAVFDIDAAPSLSPALTPEDALERAKEATTRASALADEAVYENEEFIPRLLSRPL